MEDIYVVSYSTHQKRSPARPAITNAEAALTTELSVQKLRVGAVESSYALNVSV
jgi:hypothetical protein